MTEQEKIKFVDSVVALLNDWLCSGENYYLQRAFVELTRVARWSEVEDANKQQVFYIAERRWGEYEAEARETPEEALQDVLDKCDIEKGDIVDVLRCRKTTWLPSINVGALIDDFALQAESLEENGTDEFIDKMIESPRVAKALLECDLNDVLQLWFKSQKIKPSWYEKLIIPEGGYQFDGEKFVRIGDV